MNFKTWFCIAMTLFLPLASESEPIGIFENHQPIGYTLSRGSASYYIQSGTYTLVSDCKSDGN